MPRLDWIPNKLKAPRHLCDFQRAWFIEIRDAMFENEKMQGYLPMTSDFWRIAGAHSRPMWEAHSGAVMAAFESAEVEGHGKMIFYRPLLDLIAAQRLKLRGSGRAREGPSNSASQSVLDFDSKNQIQGKRARDSCAPKKPPRYTQTDFDARDRRLLAEAEKSLENVARAQPQLSADDLLELAAERAGISIERVYELKGLNDKPRRRKAAAGE